MSASALACRLPANISIAASNLAHNVVISTSPTARQLHDLDGPSLSNMLTTVRSIATAKGSFTISSPGIPASNSKCSVPVIHVIERVDDDFVPNNLIYHKLRMLHDSQPFLDFVERARHSLPIDSTVGAEVMDQPALPPVDEVLNAVCTKHVRSSPSIDDSSRMNLENAGQRSGDGICYFWPHAMRSEVSVPYRSKHYMVLVNLKPIVPGHLLVVPLRVLPCVQFLSSEEVAEWGTVVKLCFDVLGRFSNGRNDGFAVAVQQGPHAGQTVPHLHTHVIPFDSAGRLAGEPEEGDEEEQERRKPRTTDEMAAETALMHGLFADAVARNSNL